MCLQEKLYVRRNNTSSNNKIRILVMYEETIINLAIQHGIISEVERFNPMKRNQILSFTVEAHHLLKDL